MKERCPSGSTPAFCDGGGAGRIASLVPRGAGGPPRESAESRMGGLTVRGPTVRFACRGPHDLPEPATLLSPQALPDSLPSPCFARARRCSLPQALLARRAHPASARARPLSGFCPEPVLCAQSPPLSWPHPRSARAPWPAENGRSLAAYLARYGEHGSHLRGLMRMNDPCPGNVLI